MNRNMLRYAAVTAGFVASAPALAGALRWATTGEAPAWVTRARGRRGGNDAPEPVPQVLHELELTRLADELQRVRAGAGAARAHHVRATTAAYDGVLLESCRRLGIASPRGPVPLSDADRLDVESRLMSAGMRW